MSEVRVLSWNVNGLRACASKGFGAWLAACGAEIVGVQEVRARPEQIPAEIAEPPGWHTHFVAAKRPGYSGVGIFARRPWTRIDTRLGERRFDDEGRVQIAHFGRLVVANVYFPNGSGQDRDNGRVPYKLAFYEALLERLERVRRGGRRVIVMGDFNTAHREIDLARPAANRRTSGFLPEERAEIDRWLARGFSDTFRRFVEDGGHYTWWSQRQGARERNVGWRIDYVLASKAALPYVRDAFIRPEVRGSDHCPIGVTLDPAAF